MIILIKEEGKKTTVTINGYTKEHNTAFLNRISYKDAINYLKDTIQN